MASSEKRKARSAAAPDRAATLRALPPAGECIDAAVRDPMLAALSRDYIKLLVRRAIEEIRTAASAGAAPSVSSRESVTAMIVNRVRELATSDEPRLTTVVNATGVVLHTNLGRALLAESAIEAIERAARAPVNLEYDLVSGGRGDRDSIVEEALCVLTGAEAATVVNNNAAAVLLGLTALAEGREVVVSRGELIEIGGSFRLPDVMARSGARLREVGTTNRTHPRDYIDAIGDNTALLLKVHPSNYRVVGFTAEVSLAELVEIGRAHALPVMEDLGAGALIDLSAYGLPRETIVAERVAAGAALVTFSGDKVLGGPQAGIVVGARAQIDQLKRNPLRRALRCDKLTLAALEATLRLYLRSADLAAELPTLRLLRRPLAEIALVAARARDILAERLGPEFILEIVDGASPIGSGSLPSEELPTCALRITHPGVGADAIGGMFRRARPPVIGRIRDGAFLLDLRTVEDAALLAIRLPSQG